MSSTKHEKEREDRNPFQKDLDRNPGIGQSKGLFATGGEISEIEGENTVEGDVDNDTTRSGAVPEIERERENK
jgi:hypothetical protein